MIDKKYQAELRARKAHVPEHFARMGTAQLALYHPTLPAAHFTVPDWPEHAPMTTSRESEPCEHTNRCKDAGVVWCLDCGAAMRADAGAMGELFRACLRSAR